MRWGRTANRGSNSETAVRAWRPAATIVALGPSAVGREALVCFSGRSRKPVILGLIRKPGDEPPGETTLDLTVNRRRVVVAADEELSSLWQGEHHADCERQGSDPRGRPGLVRPAHQPHSRRRRPDKLAERPVAVWALDNGTPFAVDRGFLRDRDGREIWITVVKGTFDVRDRGSLRVAEEQPPVARAAAWSGAPGKSSLLHDADFVLSKAGTDVILLGGHAYAPRGRPAASIDVTLRVGDRAKTIRAHGIRAWMRGLRSSTVVPGPAPVTERVRLSYEAAFGRGRPRCATRQAGFLGGRNLIGRGFSH